MPDESLEVFIPRLGVSHDGPLNGGEHWRRSLSGSRQGDSSDTALELRVELGSTGRGQMEVKAGMFGQPGPNGRVLMGFVAVADPGFPHPPRTRGWLLS